MATVSFVAFPCFILAILVILETSGLTGAVPNVCYNVSNSVCSVNGNSVTYSCPPKPFGQLYANPCQIASSCTPQIPSPAYCFQGAQYINPGTTMTVSVTQTAGQGLFNFGSVGLGGFIGMVAIAVSVSVMAGFNILGTGLNTMSVKILFIGGLLTGIYLFLGTVEGVLTGSATSFFIQINVSLASFSLPPLGSIAFILMSAFEVWGIVSYVSGNESGA